MFYVYRILLIIQGLLILTDGWLNIHLLCLSFAVVIFMHTGLNLVK